ncbi:MAG: putative inorganic carbon transporter subunit DabA [Actinomycetes bacterium]
MLSLKIMRATALLLLAAAVAAGVRLTLQAPLSLFVTGPLGVDVGVRLDVLSTVLLGFVASVGWLVSTFCLRNLQGQGRVERFGWLLLLATLSLALLVTGASLPVMAVGWTVSGLAVSFLVAHAQRASSLRASAYVRRCLLLGDLALWVGIVLAVAVLPTVNRADLQAVSFPAVETTVVATLLLLACIVRSGLVPMQRWLPETAEAPSPVSAFLHAGIINGAGVLVALAWPLFRAAPLVLLALVVVGLASVAVGTWTARVRHDVKGQLACSTTAQMGYLAIQLGLGLPAAAVLHLIGHGYYKGWLFLRAGGAVTRSRVASAPPVGAEPRSVSALALAGIVAVGGGALAAPAVLLSVSSLGVVAVLPAILAMVVAGVAVVGAKGVERASSAAIAVAAVASASAVPTYAWLLVGWENLLAPALPLTVTWSAPAAVLLVGSLIVAAVAIARVAAGVARHPAGPWARRLSRSALPPWITPLPQVDWPTDMGMTSIDRAGVTAAVQQASRLCAPAWPLRNVVAASPLAGLEDQPFDVASRVAHERLGGRAHLSIAHYLLLLDSGRISHDDLLAALGTSQPHDVDDFIARNRAALSRTPSRTASTSPLPPDAVEHASVWCQRAWSRASETSLDPWTMWRASGGHVELPVDPADAVAVLLDGVGIAPENRGNYVADLLLAAPGWSAHAAWRARQYASPDPLVQLVALRAALAHLAGDGKPHGTVPGVAAMSEPDAVVWQAAFERGFREPLVRGLVSGAQQLTASPSEVDRQSARPAAQLIMCIDVRSERMRRHLEAVGRYETFGFAGFFGAAIRYRNGSGQTFDQCPVLIQPTHEVAAVPERLGVRPVLRQAVGAASSAPLTPLLIAEAGGALAGLAGLAQSLLPQRWNQWSRTWGSLANQWGPKALVSTRPDGSSDAAGTDLPLGLADTERIALAAGALRAIGLVDGFAPVLVVCGHSASIENNAFAAAYDCGACGGNGGQVNARVLADILNDPAVRTGLAHEGIVVPDDTLAIAAAHDTTQDSIVFAPGAVPPSHEVALTAISDDVKQAQVLAARERLATLPGSPAKPSSGHALLRSAARRGTDWAQPCPEWGLAGNAAFVIGPRALTAGLDLRGRVFLHSYDPALDPDRSTLELILTAPVVVAQWINTQYYFSTVDSERFGAGDKATHNVVGDVGVLSGAHGDLRVGLPWQSLFGTDPRVDPTSAEHEPLRLLVVAHADPKAIKGIVESSTSLRALLVNEWFSLAAIRPGTSEVQRLGTDLQWLPWTEDARPGSRADSVYQPAYA